MEYETFEMYIEDGAFVNVPVYEEHKRGKNWMARVSKNPQAPSGLEREFVERARGRDYYYIVPDWIQVGDVIEFGADYYSCRGNKYPKRIYAVVLEKGEDVWKLALFEKRRDAFAFAKQMHPQTQKSRNSLRR